jgi:16S rRNA processing protein RimM
VKHLLETGANDVLVIADESVQRLIPYVPEVINDVDLDAGLLTVDWQADWDESS